MKLFGRLGIVITTALAIATPCAAQSSGARHRLAHVPEVAAALEVLDSWVASTVAQRDQPGVSIGIVYDQDLVWAKGYGFADLEERLPATPSTLYRIASISKLFTSTALLMLRDQGRLGLDDPVRQHLSWFRIEHAEGPPITIRHLITHTSGLPREAIGVNWQDVGFPTLEVMRTGLAEQEAPFATESVWKYSNLALSIAGEVVAEVSGMPWDQYIDTQILEPLGMTATLPSPKGPKSGLAVGYGRRLTGEVRRPEPFTDAKAISPSASVASSVEDLAKFVSLQFRDGGGDRQILKGSTLREMHRVQWLHPDWQGGQGLGFAVRRVDDKIRVGHGGAVPGHRTHVEMTPSEKLGVIVLTNAQDGDPGAYREQAFKLLGPVIAKATAETSSPSVADPAWQKWVGIYESRWGEIHIKVLNEALMMINPAGDDPWESRTLLEPLGPNTFRMVAPGIVYGSAIGEVLTFETNDRGEVVRMSENGQYWLRVH